MSETLRQPLSCRRPQEWAGVTPAEIRARAGASAAAPAGRAREREDSRPAAPEVAGNGRRASLLDRIAGILRQPREAPEAPHRTGGLP